MTPVAGERAWARSAASLVFFRPWFPRVLPPRRCGLLGFRAQQFKLLLNAFSGERCPLCVVAATIERDKIERLARKSSDKVTLCGEHLSRLLTNHMDDEGRVALARSALGTSIDRPQRSQCTICVAAQASVQRLARAILRLDRRMRFQKALEQAPMFCRHHVLQIGGGKSPANFVCIERRKVQRLINDLAQAALRKRPELESLLAEAVVYLTAASPRAEENTTSARENLSDRTIEDSLEAVAREFAKWDGERQLEHLGKLESEVASLRYRNAVLDQENRALKVARIAQEAIRHDLERDRAALLADRKSARTEGRT
jgi:hypothetical protein